MRRDSSAVRSRGRAPLDLCLDDASALEDRHASLLPDLALYLLDAIDSGELLRFRSRSIEVVPRERLRGDQDLHAASLGERDELLEIAPVGVEPRSGTGSMSYRSTSGRS
jgi:hypothetical protein